MTDDTGTPTEPIVDAPPVEPKIEPTQPQSKDWEVSYKGLQTTYQKLKTQTDKAISDLNLKLQAATAQVEELSQGGTSKDSQLSVLQKQIADLTKQAETLKGEKTTVEAQLSRGKLVMGEFPELAPFEALGQLPQGNSEDETRAALTKFRETLSGVVGADLKKLMSGATPPGSGKTSPSAPPDNGAVETEEFVWGKLVETAGRDNKAFAEWQTKWDAILLAKKPKS